MKVLNVAKSAKPVKKILEHPLWEITSSLRELKFNWLANNIRRFNYKMVIRSLPKFMINELYWNMNKKK